MCIRETFLRPTVVAAGSAGHPRSPSSSLRVALSGVAGGHLSENDSHRHGLAKFGSKKSRAVPGFRFKTVLEVPLELNARGAVSARRDERATELWRHNDFCNELFVEEVACKRRDAPSLTAHADA